jgi:protein transport protein SEC61 subunit gamma-like protein
MNFKEYIQGFLQQCARVWQLLRKPSKEEFKSIAKISALGLLILGAIGFVISIILNMFGT